MVGPGGRPRSGIRAAVVVCGTGLCAVLTGCSAASPDGGLAASPAAPRVGARFDTTGPAVRTTEPTQSTRPSTTSSEPASAATQPARTIDGAGAYAEVERIVGFGPRDAVGGNFRRAAAHVAKRLRTAGYTVREQRVPMPSGTSWGVPVPGGHTTNILADPPGFEPTEPHIVIGAHLDTVPQSRGAEDNASGVAVTLELARMLSAQPAALPVRLVVFGGEEARGDGGTRYAFGSRFLVRSLRADERAAIVGMVALDRIGVRTPSVPVCHGGRGTGTLAAAIRTAARRADVRTNGCRNRASDHVAFEAAGVPVARLGSVPYSGYHSAADVPSVVDRRQLARSGTVVWAWLRSLGP